tara:strand:- start:2172 stop:2288 length:117 start_codon:yes stop_codon:yes gene_type:complete
MTILACGQCWIGAAQAMSFVIVFGGSVFHYVKSFTKRS